MTQFKAFAISKRDYAKRVAAEKKIKPPELVWKFFDAAIDGNFVASLNHARLLAKTSGGTLGAFPLINEVSGARNMVDQWHAEFLILYMADVVGAIPKGSIYFGGTDPGRFAITMGSPSHEKADPFFTITQNALADEHYLQYLRRLYGNRIYIPSVKDNQIAFSDYLQDAMRRMERGQLAPGEWVKLNYPFRCPQCDTPHLISIDQSRLELHKKMTVQGGLRCPKDNTLMPSPAPQAQVRGNGSVMAINALLAKKIFDKNPEHDFYLEESFPLGWMMPHMVPHGLIFKLERKSLKELHQAHIAQSRKDWQKYMALCVGDAVVKPETTVAELCKWIEGVYIKNERDGFNGNRLFLEAKKETMGPYPYRKGPPFFEQKTFSKMRSGQAQLFSWRQTTTKGAELKKVYAQEADFAFRQAFALSPINTEVAFRYVHYLNSNHRFDDAKLIAQTFGKTSPDQKDLSHPLLLGALFVEERHWVSKKEYKKALDAVLERAELEKISPDLERRIEDYRRLIKSKE